MYLWNDLKFSEVKRETKLCYLFNDSEKWYLHGVMISTNMTERTSLKLLITLSLGLRLQFYLQSFHDVMNDITPRFTPGLYLRFNENELIYVLVTGW